MRILYVTVFTQLLACAYGTLPLFPERLMELPQFKGKYAGKIVGGEQVKNCSSYPHQVSIQRKSIMTGSYSHFCGGSVINANHVITAAHCASGRSASSLSIIVGTHKLDSAGKEGVRLSVANVTVFPDYNAREVDGDVAILRLTKDIDLSNVCVSEVSLPQQDQKFEPGTTCFATGWGTTSEGGSTSSVLRVVDVPLVSQEECRVSYGDDDITRNMICAGLKEGGKDSCQGDSGGPLVTEHNVLVGITSWGYGCARPDYYGVYTRVAVFVRWILSTIQHD